MKVGVPKEIMPGETRVAATPETTRKLRAKGLAVAVENRAGEGAHFTDDAYRMAGAEILDLLTSLSGEGDRTVIVVTHDAEVAGRAGRVLRMHDGRLLPEQPGVQVGAETSDVLNGLSALS